MSRRSIPARNTLVALVGLAVPRTARKKLAKASSQRRAPGDAVITGFGTVVRYDTLATFDADCAWSTMDLTQVDPAAADYIGAVFDGEFVYLVPHANGVVARFLEARSFPVLRRVVRTPERWDRIRALALDRRDGAQHRQQRRPPEQDAVLRRPDQA